MDDKANEKMEEEKHYIAILVELELYKIIETYDDSKESAKQEEIENFIQECSKRVKYLNEQQIREHIQFVLDRMRKNKEKLER